MRFDVKNLEIFICIGGATRDRTADLLNAIQALSQLSYSPNLFHKAPFYRVYRVVVSCLSFPYNPNNYYGNALKCTKNALKVY